MELAVKGRLYRKRVIYTANIANLLIKSLFIFVFLFEISFYPLKYIIWFTPNENQLFKVDMQITNYTLHLDLISDLTFHIQKVLCQKFNKNKVVIVVEYRIFIKNDIIYILLSKRHVTREKLELEPLV